MIQTPVSGEKAQERMLQMLMKGRVDLIQAPMPEVMIFAAHRVGYPIQLFCYELKGTRIPVFVAFAKSVSRTIVSKFDAALQRKIAVEDFERYRQRRFEELGIRTQELEVLDPSEFMVRP
jgi:hypothetical protein